VVVEWMSSAVRAEACGPVLRFGTGSCQALAEGTNILGGLDLLVVLGSVVSGVAVASCGAEKKQGNDKLAKAHEVRSGRVKVAPA